MAPMQVMNIFKDKIKKKLKIQETAVPITPQVSNTLTMAAS